MCNYTKNNNGLTLVEVIASIVIITIIILSLLTIFPQMKNINEKTGSNLNAANVGKELLVNIKDENYDQLKTGNTTEISNPTIDNSDSDILIISGEYKTFNIDISLSHKPEQGTKSMRKLRIDVKNDNHVVLSTIHGYLSN